MAHHAADRHRQIQDHQVAGLPSAPKVHISLIQFERRQLTVHVDTWLLRVFMQVAIEIAGHGPITCPTGNAHGHGEFRGLPWLNPDSYTALPRVVGLLGDPDGDPVQLDRGAIRHVEIDV